MFAKKKVKSSGLAKDSEINSINFDINERFLDACENGDYVSVQRILTLIKDFNIEVTDNLGRSALRLSVENEHLEVVQVLLAKAENAKIKESLLLAIYLGHLQIAELILKHPKYRVVIDKKLGNGNTDSFWQAPSSDDAQFPPDITPLILASQYNRTEIVQILLMQGDRIAKPHHFDCKCLECHNRFKFDSLRHAQSRLNSYRGLASESYISLASYDPILTAFELGHELRNLANKEKFFKTEYLSLADSLSQYTVKLLNSVRGRDELEIVLNKTGKEDEEKYVRLARLDLALKYKEMPFVANPNCQQKLVEIWYTGIRPISKMNPVIINLLFLGFIFLIPFAFLAFIFAPSSKVGKFVKQPCIKFAINTISYLTFIMLLVISSLQFAVEEKASVRFSCLFPDYYKNYSNYYNNSNSNVTLLFPLEDFFVRSSRPSNIDIAISIWVVGFIWHGLKIIIRSGLTEFLYSTKNMIDAVMIILYVGSFSLKYYTIIIVNIQLKKIISIDFWFSVSQINGTDLGFQQSVYETFYWLNQDRFYWDPYDPIFVAEGLFAIANLVSFCRICFLLPANHHLGPLQITLGKMINDILKFILIFLIIFAGFMFAINNLYWYYNPSVRDKVETVKHTNTTAEGLFGTIDLTFKTIFWAIFGLGTGSNINVSPFNNYVTENFGFVLYGAFHIASIVLLLNMLVAMMTKSYEAILAHSDTEWKYARSKLYLEYIREGDVLPVPCNLIPTPSSLISLFKKFKNRKKPVLPPSKINGKNTKRDFEEIDSQAIHHSLNNHDSFQETKLTYKIVMIRIVKRFLLHYQKDSENSLARDFEELKQDLQMIRYEMLNDLKKSKDENVNTTFLLHSGISMIGQEILMNTTNQDILNAFKQYKLIGKELRDNMVDYNDNPNSINSRNILAHVKSLSAINSFNEFLLNQRPNKVNDNIDQASLDTPINSKRLIFKESSKETLMDSIKLVYEEKDDDIENNPLIRSLDNNSSHAINRTQSEELIPLKNAKNNPNEYPLLTLKKLKELNK